jgi:hypothetical protein
MPAPLQLSWNWGLVGCFSQTHWMPWQRGQIMRWIYDGSGPHQGINSAGATRYQAAGPTSDDDDEGPDTMPALFPESGRSRVFIARNRIPHACARVTPCRNVGECSLWCQQDAAKNCDVASLPHLVAFDA